MHVVEITFFQPKHVEDAKQIKDAIEWLLASLRTNGQILGREYGIANTQEGYRLYVLVPEQDSLNEDKANSYVTDYTKKLKAFNVEYSWKVIGNELESEPVCGCKKSSFYILYTNYLLLESPIRCGDCFGVVPLYKIPATKNNEYYDILTWESDYKACDTLQMNCSTGEKFGITQLSKYDSSLSQRGIDICNQIIASTGISTYYYLHKGSGRSKRSEMMRKCPSCNGEWLLQEDIHNLFDFRCDKCKLLSNIGWSVRKDA